MIDHVGQDRVGAFICEPVVGAGGVYFPPEGYLADVQQICRDAGVLFIADEVITGFGRTGAWFGSQRYGIQPDMMTVAKGLTSGYLPLGAVLASPRVAEPFWRSGSAETFRHGYTYSGHPTACAVGLANLDIIEREQLVARVRELEPALAAALAPLAQHELVSEVRTGAGLLAGIELDQASREADPALGGRIVIAARERGVITRLLRGVALQVSPPFVISAAELHQMAEVLSAALDAALS
jgi:adenosylmethionine-8-amino-7-oxononanoate aminotransferase